MTTHELLEYAVLDAHGMLDDEERRAFEQSFAASSAAVQNQIRREQARLVDLTGLLPEVDPAPELRSRVIEAIRAEIQQTAHQSDAFAGGDGGGNTRRITHAAGQPRGRIGMRRRVSSLWRAGSLGLAAACLVLTVMLVQLQGSFTGLNQAMKGDTIVDETVRTLARDYLLDSVFDAQSRQIVFSAGGPQGEVTLVTNEKWDESILYQRFPNDAGRKLALAIVDEDGEVTEVVHEFVASGGLVAMTVPALASVSPDRLRIIETLTPGSPTIVLSPVFSTT